MSREPRNGIVRRPKRETINGMPTAEYYREYRRLRPDYLLRQRENIEIKRAIADPATRIAARYHRRRIDRRRNLVPDTHELAWAAGFYDGEGCLTSCERKDRDDPGFVRLKLSVKQVRREPLERFKAAVLGLGRVSGPYNHSSVGGRPILVFEAHKFEHIQAIVALLWKYLSEPKKEQAAKRLARAKRSEAG
jgi:hypothetical protein